MASKVGVVLKACLEHGLLVLAHPVDPVHLLLVALPDVLQHVPLLLEALLWSLHGNKGGSSHIASADDVAQSNDVWGDPCGVRRAGWQLQLGAKAAWILNVLWKKRILVL